MGLEFSVNDKLFNSASEHNLIIGDYIQFTILNSVSAFENANNNFQLLDNEGNSTAGDITTSSIFSVLTTPTLTSFTLAFISSSTA